MFDCDKCGACCTNLNKSPIYDSLHDGDGICRFLKGNLCTIYKDRPLICRVDDCYEFLFKNRMSYEEYIGLNRRYCQELKGTEDGRK